MKDDEGVAVQLHPLCVVTATVEAPPAAVALTANVETVNVHVDAGVLVAVPVVVVVVVVLGAVVADVPEQPDAPTTRPRSAI